MIKNNLIFWNINIFVSILSLLDFNILFGTFLLTKEDGSFEYGSSRWMTKQEIKKEFKVWNIGDKLKSGGIPVTYQNGKFYYSDSFDHTLIIGSTGSGKTQCEILPMIFNLGYAGESMVINDTKGELYNYTSNFLKKQKIMKNLKYQEKM